MAVSLVCVAGMGVRADGQSGPTVLREPPIPLLQQHVAGLDRQGEAMAGQEATSADPENAALLKEDGFTRYATTTYAHEGGKATLDATAMQFVDATGAASAFTFYRSRLVHARVLDGSAKVGSETAAAGDTVLVRAGTALLRVKGLASPHDLAALAASLPKVGGRAGLSPLLPTYLPGKGLDAASVRYALGPVGYAAMGGVLPVEWLSFDKSGEAITAEYAGRVGKGVLTLLLYPTPQIAGEAGRAVEQALNAPGVGTHGSMGTVKMRRVGPLLGVTTGGFTPDQAEELLASLHLNQEVAFDKAMPPEFHAEVRKTASLLQNILVFCGILAAASVLLALFLGGARAGWRVMHGKPAASDPEFLTIDLRDRPKALFVPGQPATGGAEKETG
jgi:hypothetical protein